MGAVDEGRLLEEVSGAVDGSGDHARTATGIVGAIRRAGAYRWVGPLRRGGRGDREHFAFDGPGAPAYPRFPVAQGLGGSAVASGETVVVGDVRKDPRYLTAFGSTRSEIIVPVLDRAGRKVVGTLDVESEEVDAFSEEDRAAMERCVVVVAALFEE